MRNRVLDIVVGVLLFGSGTLVAWNGYAGLKLLSFLSVTRWVASPFIVLGSLATLAALAVFLRRRVAGTVGALSMLALAVLFVPSTIDESLILSLWDDKSIQFAGYIAPAVLVLTAILVSWRFVFTPRAAAHTI